MWRRKDGEREVRRRVGLQDGANAWRAVEVVMADRWISKRTKGQCHEHLCDNKHACTETVALTEIQQQIKAAIIIKCVRKQLPG